MANVRKGQLTAARQWWKHLRWTKREFWKGERQAGKQEAQAEIKQGTKQQEPPSGGIHNRG